MRPLYRIVVLNRVVGGRCWLRGDPLETPSLEKRNVGVKTKRSDGAVRTIAWSVRFATDECDQLREKAYCAHTSVSEYIRRASLARKVIELPPPPAVNIQTYRELSSIGNNLNQLVAAVNRAVLMGQDVNVDQSKLSKLIDGLQQTIKEVQVQLLTVETSEDNEG
jgi:hypothetical protein